MPDAALPVPKHVEEAIKLTGTFFNNVAVGVTITGGIGPLLTLYLGSIPKGTSTYLVAGLSVVCVASGFALHFAARRYVHQELRR